MLKLHLLPHMVCARVFLHERACVWRWHVRVCLCLFARQGMFAVLTCPDPASSHNKAPFFNLSASEAYLSPRTWAATFDCFFTGCALKIAMAVRCSSFLALLWLVTALRSALWAAASLWWARWSVWTPCVPSSGQTPACLSPFPTRLVLSLLKNSCRQMLGTLLSVVRFS